MSFPVTQRSCSLADQKAYFTRCIYFSLQWATSAGDTAAFVGHNAFLRWSALQEVSNYDEATDKTLWWSEHHVSEDFEMSLKLQSKGTYNVVPKCDRL